MSSLFNRQIFVGKLGKLNSSQQSIETLSRWCVFHRNNAKELVETWDSEFHCSPLDKHLPFLYLANDILQNSRRKGAEFVNEYWKVLPNALNYVLENGNEDGRKAALRLIDIWEERKVFGSHGQVLKEEVLGRNLDKNYRNGKPNITKLKLGNGDILEKLISSYEQVCDGSVLEDVLFAKYQNSISYLERVKKEMASNPDFGRLNRSGILEEMQTHLDTVEECINKLAASELSRTTLLSHLREAILEQEVKIEQVHHHVQASESKSERLSKICQVPEQNVKEAPAFLNVSANLIPDVPASSGGQGIPPCNQQMATIDITSQTDEQRKSAAAAMAAKLTAATDSADLLRMVFSSLASESHGRFASEDISSENKKLRIDSGAVTPYVPEPVSSPYALSDALHRQPLPLQRLLQLQSPLQLQPPLRPLPVPEFMQNSGTSATNVPYSYASTVLQNPTMMTNYQMAMFSPAAPNPFGLATNFPASDGSVGSFSQPAESTATSPIPQ